MTYKCEQCKKEVKQCNWSPELKRWICTKCYYSKDKSIVESNHYAKPQAKTPNEVL